MPSATQFIKMSVFHLLLFPQAWPVFHDDGARRSNRRWVADVSWRPTGWLSGPMWTRGPEGCWPA